MLKNREAVKIRVSFPCDHCTIKFSKEIGKNLAQIVNITISVSFRVIASYSTGKPIGLRTHIKVNHQNAVG